MNDDIKEMLELHIKNEIDLLPKNQQKVLDYITNLQETINFQDKWLEYYKDFISENNIEDYKSKIEKAVEYIEHNTFQDSEGGWTFTFYKGKEILLDILNGRSDE